MNEELAIIEHERRSERSFWVVSDTPQFFSAMVYPNSSFVVPSKPVGRFLSIYPVFDGGCRPDKGGKIVDYSFFHWGALRKAHRRAREFALERMQGDVSKVHDYTDKERWVHGYTDNIGGIIFSCFGSGRARQTIATMLDCATQ